MQILSLTVPAIRGHFLKYFATQNADRKLQLFLWGPPLSIWSRMISAVRMQASTDHSHIHRLLIAEQLIS